MKLVKWLDRHLEEVLLILLMLSIVVVMLLQIVRRYFLNSSLTWSEEFCRYCFIWFMFVGYSYSIRVKSELRVEAIVNMMPERIGKALELLCLVICAGLSAYLFKSSFTTVANVVRTGEISVGLHLPLKYLYLSVSVGFGLGTFRYLEWIVLTLRGRGGEGEEGSV